MIERYKDIKLQALLRQGYFYGHLDERHNMEVTLTSSSWKRGSEGPEAIPSHERPSIVEIVLLLVLSCAATVPAKE